jgi:hypothetical protein
VPSDRALPRSSMTEKGTISPPCHPWADQYEQSRTIPWNLKNCCTCSFLRAIPVTPLLGARLYGYTIYATRGSETGSQTVMRAINMTHAMTFTSQLCVFIQSRTWGMSRCARLWNNR